MSTLTNMILTAIMNNNTTINALNKQVGPRYYNESYHYPKNNKITKINKHITYNSKIMRKNHNIKQPGIDVQRKIH
jgi:hypothetical protein